MDFEPYRGELVAYCYRLRAAFASPEGRAAAADAARLQELIPVRSMIITVDDSVM